MTASRLGPYALLAPIGRGGMGAVWSAIHEPTGLPVAIKVIGEGQGTETQREALRREIRTIARLDHPNVVAVLDQGLVPEPAPPGLVEGSRWLAMERADGDLFRKRPAGWRAIRHVLLEVLAGLAHIHARGLVHRDLKPENVLAFDGSWKLADLGIAHALRGLDAGSAARAAGSPAYMAPEQLRGELDRQGPPTDLYALGCMAWELAAGTPPFARPTVTEVAWAHLHEVPPAFPGGPVPPGFEAWVRALLVKDPDQRVAFAADAAEALRAFPDEERVGSGGPIAAAPATTWSTLASIPPQADMDSVSVDEPALGAATPPADWRRGSVRPSLRPRHGSELALAGLRSPPLFGREEVQDRLWAALAAVRAEGRARLVLVTGPAGVGRSALLRWLTERAIETGAARVWLRTRGGGDPLPNPGDLGALERPALLALDDVLSDGPARGLALRLLQGRAVEAVPALVVVAESTEALGDSDELGPLRAAAGSALDQIALGPLEDSDVESMVQNLVHLDDSTTRRTVLLAAGSPRVTVDVVAAWIRVGAVVPGPDGYRVESAAALDAALQLGASELARLEAVERELTADDAHAIELCAAVGAHADQEWRVLFRWAGLEVSPDLADRLLDSGLAEGDPARWGLVRGVVRAAIEKRSRDAGRWPALCGAAAEVFVQNPTWSRRAGPLLFEAGRYEEALDLLVEGWVAGDSTQVALEALDLREEALRRMGLQPSDPRWADQFERRARALHSRGRLRDSRIASEQLIVEARRHGWRAAEGMAHGQIGAIELLQAGDPVTPSKLAWEILQEHGTPLQRANARLSLLFALTHSQQLDEALVHAEAFVEESASRPSHHCVALRARGLVHMFLGDDVRSERDALEAYHRDLEDERWNGAGFSAQNLGMLSLDRERTDEATTWLREAVELHLRSGNLYGARNAILNQGECLLRAGALDEAEALVVQSEVLTRALGGSQVEVSLVWSHLAAQAGDLAQARARLPDPGAISSAARLEMMSRDRALGCWIDADTDAFYAHRDELRGCLARVRYVPSAVIAAIEGAAHRSATLGRPEQILPVIGWVERHLDRHAPPRAAALREALGR